MGKKGKKAKKSKKSKSSETTSKDADKPSDYYYGEYTFTFTNGDIYEGGYCAHRLGYIWREGHGKYITHDGQTYEGEWRDDKLIDGQDLTVSYPNGTIYHGRLTKNKYDGHGNYIMPNELEINCDFKENKPTGKIQLIDINGRIWGGQAMQESAIMVPENIYYKNIEQTRGKGRTKYKIPEEMEEEEQHDVEWAEEEEIDDREWEKRIFAKSKKTESDLYFEGSEWYRKYDLFMRRKRSICRKIQTTGRASLSPAEAKWLAKYEKFKAKQRIEEKWKGSGQKPTEREVDLSLLKTFYSKEYWDMCQAMKVFYPSPDWDPFYQHPDGSVKEQPKPDEILEELLHTEDLQNL